MSNIQEIQITPEMLERANKKAEELGELKNSITRGKGNVVGFLGEEIANVILKGDIVNTRDYDIVMEDGTKVDVKSKKCSSEPLDHYDCSVASYNTSQKCDEYVFVRVHKDLTKGWVLGKMKKDEFYKNSVEWKRGQYDPRNRWHCKADCHSMPISQLNEVSSS